MPITNPDVVFKGKPCGPTRNHLSRIVAAVQPATVVIPNAGEFSFEFAALEAGIPADRIVSGDISLFSHSIGMAILGQDYRLEIKRPELEWLSRYMTDPIAKCAAISYAARLSQIGTKTQYARDQHYELTTRADHYIDQLKSRAAAFATRLAGLGYQTRCMFETIAEHLDDPTALLLVDPPMYQGGYVKMFEGLEEIFDWDRPKARQFSPNTDYDGLMENLLNGAATSVVTYATRGDAPTDRYSKWHQAFCYVRDGANRYQWLLANRPGAFPVDAFEHKRKLSRSGGLSPFLKGAIGPKSRLGVARLPREVVQYYQDLFVHRLQITNAELYAGFFVDGKLLACLGLHLRDWRRSAVDYIGLVFMFTAPHTEYAKIGKLSLMLLTSRQMRDWLSDVGKDPSFYLSPPAGIQTTCLSPHPETKIHRGIMRQISRDRDKHTGEYKLVYRAKWHDWSFQEAATLWLTKYQSSSKRN